MVNKLWYLFREFFLYRRYFIYRYGFPRQKIIEPSILNTFIKNVLKKVLKNNIEKVDKYHNPLLSKYQTDFIFFNKFIISKLEIMAPYPITKYKVLRSYSLSIL